MSKVFPFPILGTETVPLIGREQAVARIWSSLTKATPSNLSVVGPRYIGKSVVLARISELAKTDEASPYKLVVFWELGYAPPQSDDEFIDQLCDQLIGVMGGAAFQEARDYLRGEKSFGALREVTELLQADGANILMIWDGFDKPLSQGMSH